MIDADQVERLKTLAESVLAEDGTATTHDLARGLIVLVAEVQRLRQWKDAAEITVNAVALHNINEVARRLTASSDES